MVFTGGPGAEMAMSCQDSVLLASFQVTSISPTLAVGTGL